MEKEIKLKVEKGMAIYAKPITKEFNEKLEEGIYLHNVRRSYPNFKEVFGYDAHSILAHGDVKVSESFISKYIPSTNWHPFGQTEITEKSCYCYTYKSISKKEHDIKQVRLHHDCLSSWNCILQLLNNPKYVIIYAKPNVDINITEDEIQLRLKQDQLRTNIKINETV